MFSKRDYLKKYVGKKITVNGKISAVIWQHMTKRIETHPNMIYFDLEDDSQTILYSKNEIVCKGRVGNKTAIGLNQQTGEIHTPTCVTNHTFSNRKQCTVFNAEPVSKGCV